MKTARDKYATTKWESALWEVRGRAKVEAATAADVDLLLAYIKRIEAKLDEGDNQDMCGTEGWRHFCNVE